MSAASPVRHPDVRSRAVMTRRAWWLVVLNVLIPGSAQVLAGSRRLGRFGLGATILLWILAAAAIVVAIVDARLLLPLVTNSFALLALVALAAFYGVLWIVLTLDTLRLVRLVRVAPAARVGVAGLALVVLVATSGVAAYGVVNGLAAARLLDTVFGSGAEIAEPVDGRYNILVLGGDAGPDRVGLRPDSISVVSVDAATGRTAIVGVPRNLEFVPFAEDSPLWGPFPNGYDCGVECLISYLYTYAEEHPELYPEAEAAGSTPGVEATRDAVEGVTGLTLQYHVLLDMHAFSALIDALGGIEIDSTGRYPIGGDVDANGQPINVGAWIEPGPQHMDGNRALWYARSRHGTDDYDRMKRQRQVQEAILRQFEPGTVLLRFQDIAAAGAELVDTDIPQGMLSHFVSLAAQAREQPVDTLELSPPLVETWQPDFARIRELVAEVTAPVTPSPAPPS